MNMNEAKRMSAAEAKVRLEWLQRLHANAERLFELAERVASYEPDRDSLAAEARALVRLIGKVRR